MSYFTFYFLYLLPSLLIVNETKGEDLYQVLGVHRTASTKQIKQAYKNLAKEWHPDKNQDPQAADKFTKINEAYETLGDQERRRQYDKFGYTSAQEQRPQRRGGPFGDPFEDFFNDFPGFGKFHFGGSGAPDSFIDKYDINFRIYESKYLPESYQKPVFLYAYAEFCFECARMEPILERFVKELESVGIGIGAFHAGRVGRLTNELRVHRVPALLAVIDGRISEFKGVVSLPNLRQFVRGLFPYSVIQKITDKNIKEFLDGWSDNRMRAIFFGQSDEISAKFLAPAFYYRHFVSFGYVNTRSSDVGDLLRRFNVNANRKSLLMFNEDTKSAAATISMQQLSRSSIDEVIESNKFLLLPRLSSQTHFEELCPAEMKARKKRLCVVLITNKNEEIHRERFRKYLQHSSLTDHGRVQFAYMYPETQTGVMRKLDENEDTHVDRSSLKIVIIWRQERNYLQYEWLKNGWSRKESQVLDCERQLEKRIKELLNSDELLAYKILLPEFNNEHALHLFVRILHKLHNWGERLWRYLTSYDGLTWATVLMSIFMVFGMGYFMSSMASIEEEQIRARQPRRYKPRPPSRAPDQKTVNLYELQPDMYDTLVLNSDTGLTMVLLVNNDAKDKLIKKFKEIVLPLTRYSGLSFAFLQLESYIGWYRNLLEDSMENRVTLDRININNCIGTVLGINGTRNYYYIYQPKKARKWIRQSNKNLSGSIGMFDSDDNSDSDDDTRILLVEELLDGLLDWFDRVFDGSQKKIRISAWPDLTAV